MMPLFVAVPFFFAFLVLILHLFDLDKNVYRILFLTGIFLPWVVFLFYHGQEPYSMIVGGWERFSGIEVALDEKNTPFILAQLILFSGAAVYVVKYFDMDKENPKREPAKSIYPLILIFHGGILGTLITRDIFNFFVYKEIASISSIVLIAFSVNKGSKIASFRYLMIYFVSTFFFIFAMGLIYVKTGYLNFELIAAELSQNPVGTEIRVALAMMALSLITKAGIFPMYVIVPEAYAKSDDPVSAMLSGMGGKIKIFGLILVMGALPFYLISDMMMAIALSSMIFGTLMALTHENIKKFLAYSSISQMGYILFALSVLETQAAIYHSFIHALGIGGLFLIAGALITSQGTKKLRELSFGKNPVLMISSIVLSLSIIGVYPFLMSHTKGLVTGEISGALYYLFYAVSVGTVMYLARFNYHLFRRKPEEKRAKVSWGKSLPPLIFSLVMIFSGIYVGVEFALTDFLVLAVGVGLFLLLQRMKIFRVNIPEPFTHDRKGLAREINVYTGIYLVLNLAFLIALL